MSTEQHEALKLADQLDRMTFDLDRNDYWRPTVDMAGHEIRSMHALIVQMAEALESACDHIEMGALEVSHCKDHERITQAIAAATQYLTRGPKT